MNKLSPEKQEIIIQTLVEGASIRSVERMTGVHRDTIMRLGVRVGESCERLLDVMMRGLPCQRLELDEIWCYVGKKQRRITEDDDATQVGDFWTWVALDAETKLIPSYRVGKRDLVNADAFVGDLASRLTNRVQLSTDGLRLYVEAVDAAFAGQVDYAQIVKTYEAEPIGEGRYSPPKVTAVEKKKITGEPVWHKISTSYVERQNLTMRMQMRRFTRLTNGFSKKLENLQAAIALHFAHYNFVRRHSTLKTAPAVAAGVIQRPWTVRELIYLAD